MEVEEEDMEGGWGGERELYILFVHFYQVILSFFWGGVIFFSLYALYMCKQKVFVNISVSCEKRNHEPSR